MADMMLQADDSGNETQPRLIEAPFRNDEVEMIRVKFWRKSGINS